ncbi:hypothetical protein [Paractinoplanes durhamensis]|uniref:Copper chaperone PCu(A)C n=1 Tax=Paractinoplanes durhamensis TaxID=113563 RepID=A0ABQ3ZD08_9ACTN|nr:hypothetical protein [Actinoplanes durhamensis]GIE07685.1 hypothetical protein Adu01nite_90350 [Actinoplanes durhamensis]
MPRTTAGRLAHRGLILSVLGGALALGACSAQKDSAAPSATATTTSAAPAASAAGSPASPSGTATPGKNSLPDGVHDAYLVKVDTGARTVSFDKVEMLTGDAALAASQKENPGATDGPPNDYMLVNANKLVRTLPVAETVEVAVLGPGGGPELTPGSFTKLPAFLAVKDNSTLFKLTVKNGKITAMKGIYLP